MLVMQHFRVVYYGISHESLVLSRYTHEPLGKCVYQENTSDKWVVPPYNERKCCITSMPCQKMHLLNFARNKNAAHDGKVGFNTVEYTTVFLYSDWLHFLLPGMKGDMDTKCIP